MTDERWKELLGRLKDEKKIEEQNIEELGERPGSVERVVIISPLGKLRLSRTTEPKRIDQKAHYSKRGGSTMSVQNLYDESDQIHVFTIEKQESDGQWTILDPKSLPF